MKKDKMKYARYKDKRNKKIKTHRKTILMTGKFLSTTNGGIFFELLPDGKLSEEKYYVESRRTLGAMHGDIVEAELAGGRDVRIRAIAERATEKLIGILYTDERYDPAEYVEPENGKIRFTVAVTGYDTEEKAKDGDKVEIKLTYYPESDIDEPEGVITKVFGQAGSGKADYEAILYSNDVRTVFPEEVIKEAEKAAETEIRPDVRTDLRDEVIFTIDGAGAKDLDDAISAKKSGENYILGVHIADVSHYVTNGTETDKEAIKRGTSIYFADKVVPMLPTALSNGICSLNAGEDRYTLSAFMTLDKFGEIKKTEICKSIIRSKVRGVYSEINELIDGTADDKIKEKYRPVTENGTLGLMLEIYHKLKKKSLIRGAIELDSSDEEIILDETGEPTEIIKCERGEGEKLIEQFMLTANEGVANWMTDKHLPCIYRVHDKPDTEKVSALLTFANNIGLCPEYVKKENVTPGYFNKLLEKARKKEMGTPVSYMMLRTMQKAKYSENNIGHFGLASKCYCHFTSPIRRYPDLGVHRIISEYLENGSANKTFEKYILFAKNAAKSSSECELKALEAERGISDLYKTIYMKKHIGEVYDATVSSVTSFGLFCMLDNTCEGLVPIDSMKNRYWYSESDMTLNCAAVSYGLGKRVKIRVVSADVSGGKIEFALEDEPENGVGRGYSVTNRAYVKKKR